MYKKLGSNASHCSISYESIRIAPHFVLSHHYRRNQAEAIFCLCLVLPLLFILLHHFFNVYCISGVRLGRILLVSFALLRHFLGLLGAAV